MLSATESATAPRSREERLGASFEGSSRAKLVIRFSGHDATMESAAARSPLRAKVGDATSTETDRSFHSARAHLEWLTLHGEWHCT